MAYLDSSNAGVSRVAKMDPAMYGDEHEVREYVPSKEEQMEQIANNETDFIQGLISAADYLENEEEQKRIEIERPDGNGDYKVLFAFNVRPLSEREYSDARNKHTKFVRNKSYGIKMPEETNTERYHAQLIYMATVAEDREKLWNNKQVWAALNEKPNCIVNTALDVIMCTMKAGEIDKVISVIDQISGFDSNLEEVIKN